MNSTGFLGQRISVRMDRPLGSRHPDGDFEHPVNDGDVPGIPAPDGEELDAHALEWRSPWLRSRARASP